MAETGHDINKNIESLVNATDSILKGEYGQPWAEIDAEGMLSVLAQRINALVVNMKNVATPLTSAGEQAPTAVQSATDVIALMARSTSQVLDSADMMTSEVEELEKHVEAAPVFAEDMGSRLVRVKTSLFDIIASQSYQDVARQKMESLIADLAQIRDWLVEVLVILNIQKDSSKENLEQKKKILREVAQPATSDEMKQDLVDDLLSEFGF